MRTERTILRCSLICTQIRAGQNLFTNHKISMKCSINLKLSQIQPKIVKAICSEITFIWLFLAVSAHPSLPQRWIMIFFNSVLCKWRKVALASHLQWNTGSSCLLKDTQTHNFQNSYLDNLTIAWGFQSPLFILHIVEICKYTKVPDNIQ